MRGTRLNHAFCRQRREGRACDDGVRRRRLGVPFPISEALHDNLHAIKYAAIHVEHAKLSRFDRRERDGDGAIKVSARGRVRDWRYRVIRIPLALTGDLAFKLRSGVSTSATNTEMRARL